MENKLRLLSIVGTILFLSGTILVLAVIAIWQLAPRSVPANYESLDNLENPTHDLPLRANGPALSPFTPTESAVPSLPSVRPTSAIAGLDENQWQDSSGIAAGPGWPVLTYPEGSSEKPNDTRSTSSQMSVAIPDLDINAPVLPVSLTSTADQSSRPYQQWTVPDEFAAGWHDTSARPGQPGNIVLNGHNNIYGAIFHDLADLPLGAEIILYDAGIAHIYRVTGREFLLERGEPLRDRLRNARWIMPTAEERMTIVTCWPNTSNSHRLVVVAEPVEQT